MYSKIRSKRAMEDCTSVVIDSIWPMGKNSRACSVVKATMSPGVRRLCWNRPATRYTRNGVTEKNVPTRAKK